MKFGRQMQNGMPMTIHRSKSKPEIEFQYGGRPFSETGSSYISAMDWDISSKFDMQIDFHLLKHIPSLNLNPEVHFRLYGRHLENSVWRHNSDDDRPIPTNLAGRCKMTCRWLCIVEIKTANRIPIWRPSVFLNRSFISAVDWDMLSKFGLEIDFRLLRQVSLSYGCDMSAF